MAHAATLNRETRLTRLEVLVTGLLVLTLTGLLVMLAEREGYFLRPTGESITRRVLAERERFQTRRMGIYLHGERVGSTETRLEAEENGFTRITTTTDAKLVLLRRRTLHIETQTSLVLDAEGVPNDLTGFLRAENRDDFSIDIEGLRQADRMHILLRRGDEILLRDSFPLTDVASFDSGLMPVGDMPGLSVGESFPLQYVNPITRTREHGLARVVEEDPILWKGTLIAALRVEVEFSGNSLFRPVAHVAPDGRLLRLAGLGDYVFVREGSPAPSKKQEDEPNASEGTVD